VSLTAEKLGKKKKLGLIAVLVLLFSPFYRIGSPMYLITISI